MTYPLSRSRSFASAFAPLARQSHHSWLGRNVQSGGSSRSGRMAATYCHPPIWHSLV